MVDALSTALRQWEAGGEDLVVKDLVVKDDLFFLYKAARDALQEKIALGEASSGDLVKLLDRIVHWMRVFDEKPTDVTKHWLEEIHERLGDKGINGGGD